MADIFERVEELFMIDFLFSLRRFSGCVPKCGVGVGPCIASASHGPEAKATIADLPESISFCHLSPSHPSIRSKYDTKDSISC